MRKGKFALMLLSSIKSALNILGHVVWFKYLEHTFFFWKMPHFPTHQPKSVGTLKRIKKQTDGVMKKKIHGPKYEKPGKEKMSPTKIRIVFQ